MACRELPSSFFPASPRLASLAIHRFHSPPHPRRHLRCEDEGRRGRRRYSPPPSPSCRRRRRRLPFAMPQRASRSAPPPSRRPAISTSSRHSPPCAAATLPSHHRIAHPSCHPSQPSRTKIRRDGRTASGSRWPAGPATAAGGRGPRGSRRPATSSCGRGLPSPLEHAVKAFKSTRPGTWISRN
ncbi:hypothetical protein PVAP13_5NG263400 [Panicum virgatum]|uniref:Uncharacterized protein n=1 Tax=Panicum virgatum TaxID=38727 RepID=A0A8T0RWS6_PANVG|nr:hypothetical protein PVAP13_5NG263400 [Panicum virgatum]